MFAISEPHVTELMIMHLAAGSLTGIARLTLMNVHVSEGGPYRTVFLKWGSMI